ncbi:MAG TPA: glycogen-binding domain-containing protein [Verrucomicrobiota bacterium]|nr:glycogen-binding domain-containing protein [Verrucomicrobiota bacterium]HQL76884.1 glycogen-binding domain-containing protein [Verrucomicrobiota bacterium]
MSRRSKKPKMQTFRYGAPEATSVMLVGDFTEWQQNALVMDKEPDGVWSINLKLPPGKHSYLFIVDGKWCEDPECTVRVPNPFGGHDMVREVS